MPWQPAVEMRSHPLGEQGVRSSLEEVARKSAAILSNGDHFVRVKTWTGRKLHEARARGADVSTDRGRAAAILRVVQTEKLWVPDPVGMEFITGAHLMACDRDEDNPEGVCVQAEDCDGKTVLLTACFLSIGLHCVICGHGYDKEHPRLRRLQHVIDKVRVGSEWLYADASYEEFPLGKCHPFTRERVLSLPDRRVICDGESCSSEVGSFDPEDHIFERGSGTYIGVDGVPRFQWLGEALELGVGKNGEVTPYEAAWDMAKERKFGTSKDDVKAYGTAAGAAGGAAACCATGVGCAAAPACAWLGGEIGGRIAGAVYDLFAGDKPTGVASNQAKDWKAAWNSKQGYDAFRMFALGCVEELRGKPIQFTESNLKAQDDLLAPAMGRMAEWPWKDGVPPPKKGEPWSTWVGRLGAHAIFSVAKRDSAMRQYQAALVASAGDVVGKRSELTVRAQQSPPSSGGGVAKVAALAGIAAGVAWIAGIL